MFEKGAFVLLMNRKKWKNLLNMCPDMQLKQCEQKFVQPLIY